MTGGAEEGYYERRSHTACGGDAEGNDFSGVSLETLRAAHPAFDDEALTALDPRVAAERRASFGGTAPDEIARQVEVLSGWIDETREA